MGSCLDSKQNKNKYADMAGVRWKMASNQYAIDQFENGKAGKGSAMWSNGEKLYSYGTVILQRLDDGSVVGNITKYSMTTSKHQSQARVRGYVAHKLLTNIPMGTTDLMPYLIGGAE
uniref:DUF8033 domain-containing protein n=1 Tax=viral metagenome TaxID=1070528 RepID=A0A6H1ZFN5_9ZZZZ